MTRQSQDPNQEPEKHQYTRSMGRGMYSIAWLLAIGLLTLFFSDFEQRKVNPNQNPNSQSNNGITEVILKQNRQGHYVTNGSINGKDVIFLVDTGATDVSIPLHIADKLGLQKGQVVKMNTANGTVKGYESWIEELRVGEIKLNNIDANINPGMTDNFILLGMSALKDLEFTQRDNKLTLKAYY
jgi:aspartyl protease family protein